MTFSTSNALDPAVDTAIDEILDLYAIPGAVIAAVQGEKLYIKTHGVKSVVNKEPVTDTTAFNIASNSKAFLSAAVALLVDRGRLSWDDPVRQYVPEIDFNDPWMSEQATLRDLCANRTGLQRQGLAEFWADPDTPASDLFSRVQHVPSLAGFRTRFTYMNVGHMAVAAAVERVSDKKFLQFINDEFFSPLGMEHSSGGRVAEQLSDKASGHARTNSKTLVSSPVFSDTYLGASSMYVCGRDALAWIKFHIGEGTFSGHRIVERSSLLETHSAQTIVGKADRAAWLGSPDSPIIAYGLGWAISTFAGQKLICHAGLETGTSAQTSIIADAGIGVAIYANNISPAPQVISYMMLDALLKRPQKDWNTIVTDPELPSPLPAELQPFLLPALPTAKPILFENITQYCGSYHTPTSGDATVFLQDEKLRLKIHGSECFDSTLIPIGEHCFVAAPDDVTLHNVLGGYPRVDFHLDGASVTEFHIPWLGSFSAISFQQ